jgi:hypothetical protein
MPSLFLILCGGVLWIAVSALAVALCRVAAQPEQAVSDPAAPRGQRHYTPRPDGGGMAAGQY